MVRPIDAIIIYFMLQILRYFNIKFRALFAPTLTALDSGPDRTART